MLNPQLEQFIRKMPKVELHVHLKASVKPETLLKLAQRNNIELPANTLPELQEWYRFRDFNHFISIVDQIYDCFRTPEDLELATREFLASQAAENIRYTEITYTATRRIPINEQMAALNSARKWAEDQYGVEARFIFDMPRGHGLATGLIIANWAVQGMDDGVVALGLGGLESEYPPEPYAEAFALAHEAGLPCVPHAGEMAGPESIWGALKVADPPRIGHGVRCIEDPELVAELCRRQTVLEVSPTSNVCLGVYDSMQNHPLPRLVDEGLIVTINSDDPPLFNTTLTDEYMVVADTFGYDADALEGFVFNALDASFLPDEKRSILRNEFRREFCELKTSAGV